MKSKTIINLIKEWRGRILAVTLAAGIVILATMALLPKPPVPPHIKQQLTSTLLVPGRHYKIDHDTIKYDSKLKLLSLNIKAYGKTVVLSEQPTPDAFSDVPQVYDKLVAGMLEYAHFDTDVGSVHLTRPKQLQGKQAAVLNSKGTLLFAKPSEDLTQDQWRQFFNSFSVSQ